MADHIPQLLQSESVFQGSIISVQVDDLVLQSGREVHREIVVHPEAVCGIATMPDGKIILVRQYRHPAAEFLWEIPAGKIDHGETPEQTFRRELLEECGVACGPLHEVLCFYPSPGVLTERIHLFVTKECQPDAAPWDTEEISEWKTVTVDEARAMIDRGEIVDGKSIIGILYAGRTSS